MELRHLRYFMAVARELHFTRAAESLGIGQPPLSQQIQQLEQEVGAQLFLRDRRGVQLTDAGHAFLADAQLVLEGAERAKESARRVANGEIGALSIGFTVSASIHPFVPRLIRTYRQRYPGVSVTLYEQMTVECVDRVRNGTLDLAFIRTPTDEAAGVRLEPILTEPMMAVIPTSHPLADEQAIELKQLADSPFILYPRKAGFGVYDSIIAACEQAGFAPDVRMEAPQLTSIITLVAAGMGVSVVPATMSQLQAEGVCYVPLLGTAPIAQLAIAFRTRAPSMALSYAISLTRESAAHSSYRIMPG